MHFPEPEEQNTRDPCRHQAVMESEGEEVHRVLDPAQPHKAQR